jgi:hypothetical protein
MGPVEVHDGHSLTRPQGKLVAVLSPGEAVAVVGCEDLRSFIAPEVVLSDGKTGYVIGGDLSLRREPPWSWAGKPTCLTCPGAY